MQQIALITGASSGIGEATARLFARRGYSVVLAARRKDRLDELADEIRSSGGRALAIPCDVSLPEDRTRLLRETVEGVGFPDVLVNNAGSGWYGFVRDMEESAARSVIRVNVEGAAAMVLLVLPGMVERKRGHILNVGSIMGKFAVQGSSVYAATKAWMDSFSRSLYRETRGSGVKVSLLRPGPIVTGFYGTATTGEGTRPMPGGGGGIGPERVARALLRLTEHPRRAAWVPWHMRIIAVVDPLFGWVLDLIGPRGVAAAARIDPS